ncbi:MAG: SpoIIE family protein phosphatase [candidate division KSB1 bacterium]|nr:SpoIIE family protein phosphatase [candidate division KSB1 bacterium]
MPDIAQERATRQRGSVELQSLFELSRAISSSRDFRHVLDVLLLTPMGRMLISRGAILLPNGHGRFAIAAAKGVPHEWQQQVFAFQKLPRHIVAAPAEDLRHYAARLPELGFNLLCPIYFDDRCLGVLALGNKLDGSFYSKNELEYLQALANIAAPVLENNRHLHALEVVNKQLDRKIQELQTLFEIGNELNSTLDKKTIADSLCFAIMGEMMVQHCVVLLMQAPGEYEVLACKGQLNPKEVPLLQQADLMHQLLQLQRPLRLQDIPESGLRSVLKASHLNLYIPLMNQDEVKGAVLLGKRFIQSDYSDNDLQFLSTLANAATISLENARLFQEALEKQRMDEELAIARDIQQRLLPASPPELPGFDLAGLNWPSKQVGGDYYDFFLIDSNRLLLAIGDVSGKGVPASLLMANLQASLRALIYADMPLTKIVARINDIIHENTAIDKFITFFVAIIDIRNRALTFVNAGHNPPILIHQSGEVVFLETGGLLLGMMPNVVYEEETVPLASGDWLILYTDGVSEAMNAEDEEFTEKRILQAVHKHADLSAAELVEVIAREVIDFTNNAPQADDITLVALHLD